MRDDERIWEIKALLFDYVKSPSLRHIRDPYSVSRLAQEIVRGLDRGNSIWRKWDPQCELLLKSAVACWIPIEDLQDFLNGMPGPSLTTADVAQRLKNFEEEQSEYPNEAVQVGCQALYVQEKTANSELPAIIGLLREYIEAEEERIRAEQEARSQQSRQEVRLAQERRLLSGADCKWTQTERSEHWYCRTNGRTYRLAPTNDKKWNLFRVGSPSDGEQGVLIGTYLRRGDATKVVAQVAYAPDQKR